MDLGDLTLDEAARTAAGNWMKFECFWWNRIIHLDDPENWAIIYTHNRDSGLLDQSNASVIDKTLKPFAETDDPDVAHEHHAHFACGWVDGFSIRVYRNDEITSAFTRYHEIITRLASYPVLDEEDYSLREVGATLENISTAAWRLKNEYELPDDWEGEVYGWLSDHDPGSIENRDDQGGCPSEEQLEAAFEALGYRQIVDA